MRAWGTEQHTTREEKAWLKSRGTAREVFVEALDRDGEMDTAILKFRDLA
jgi:hypothetical protein